SVIEAALLFAAAGAGAWYAPGAEWPALFVGITLVFTRAWVTGLVLSQAGITARQRIAAQFPAWGLALLAAGIVWYADIAAVGQPGWAALHEWVAARTGLPPRWSTALAETLRGGSLGLAFAVLYAALIRLFMPGAVAEAVAFVPKRLRGIATRLMFINLQPAATAEQTAVETAQSGRNTPL
ncbi:MAG TPA: hypothetical protein VFF65_11210, partial [Phycisphaerales bacterium]|nr:hypothetical protein [Phycisphaerales bacterium]